MACGEDTVFLEGRCVPYDDTLEADHEEASEDNDPTLGGACPVYACLFVDFGGYGGGMFGGGSGGPHEARYAEGSPATLVLMRHPSLEETWTCKQQ